MKRNAANKNDLFLLFVFFVRKYYPLHRNMQYLCRFIKVERRVTCQKITGVDCRGG